MLTPCTRMHLFCEPPGSKGLRSFCAAGAGLDTECWHTVDQNSGRVQVPPLRVLASKKLSWGVAGSALRESQGFSRIICDGDAGLLSMFRNPACVFFFGEVCHGHGVTAVIR